MGCDLLGRLPGRALLRDRHAGTTALRAAPQWCLLRCGGLVICLTQSVRGALRSLGTPDELDHVRRDSCGVDVDRSVPSGCASPPPVHRSTLLR